MVHLVIFTLLYVCEAFFLPQGCIDVEVGINCTIDNGGAKVQCPKKNVIRVIGDYQNFSVHCDSEGPMKFAYDGTKPTEAIRINKWREVTLDSQTTQKPTVIREHIKVEVLSVLNLIDEYKKTLTQQPLDGSISKAIYYSRTGEFNFTALKDVKLIRVKFVIFFEEPGVEPSFINRYDQNVGWLARGEFTYFVGCRSTFYVQPEEWGEPELWVNGEKVRQDKAHYDPTDGFFVSSSWHEILRMHSDTTSMRCSIPKKNSLNKTIEFDPLLTKAVSGLAVKQETEEHIWTYISQDGNLKANCIPHMSTLNFIGARNPDEQVLVRDFVLPELANRSLYVEKGTPSEKGMTFQAGVQTHRGTSLHFGALYCGGGQRSNLRSFVTDIQGQSSFLEHSLDWRRLGGRKQISNTLSADQIPWRADPKLYLALKNTHPERAIYDFDNLTFQCNVHPFFSRPVVWQIEQNKTIIRQVSAEPKFEQHQPLIYEFEPDAVNAQVKVMAGGVPSPTITCTALFLDDGSDVKQAPSITKVFEARTNVTEAKFRINCMREAKLKCEAKNGRGVAHTTINIRIKSNRCNDGTRTVYGRYALSLTGAGLWLTLNIIRMLLQ